MGLFDIIKSEYPGLEGNDWQTKHLGRDLGTYHLTKEGRLLKQYYEIADVPEEEQIVRFGVKLPLFKRVPTELLDINFHGVIEMHQEDRVWLKFNRGQLEDYWQDD